MVRRRIANLGRCTSRTHHPFTLPENYVSEIMRELDGSEMIGEKFVLDGHAVKVANVLNVKGIPCVEYSVFERGSKVTMQKSVKWFRKAVGLKEKWET